MHDATPTDATPIDAAPADAAPTDAAPTDGIVTSWSPAALMHLLDVVPDGLLLVAPDGTVLAHNTAVAETLAEAGDDLRGEDARAWRRIDVAGRPLAPAGDPLAGPAGTGADGRMIGVVRTAGDVRWVHLWSADAPAPDDGDVPPGRMLRVVPARPGAPPRVGAGTPLAHAAALHGADPLDVDALFGQRTVGMLRLSPAGEVLQANDAAARLLGTSAQALLGQTVADLIHPEDLRADAAAIDRLSRGEIDHHRCEVRLRAAHGWAWVRSGITAFHGGDGRVTDYIALVVDDSGAHGEDDTTDRLALDDALTSLVSRHSLLRMLDDRLAVGGRALAVVAVNVDRFRAVNDTLGQAVGDDVLVEIAGRVRGLLQPADAAARLGGDDFVVLFDDVSTRAHARALVGRLLEVISEPLAIGGLTLKLTASAGVALASPLHMASADEAIMHATAALRAAKRSGRARLEVYDEDLAVATTNRLRIETSLRQALDADELTVAYQPIRDLAAGTLTGAEALVRWADARLGPMTPDEFVPIAQDSGLVEPLTSFVLQRAVEAASGWRAAGADVHVAVNLTAQDLSRRGLAAEVTAVLADRGLPPRALRLEIVETVLVEAGQQVRRNLDHLRDLGVGLGIDDFGTGYSSMAYLKQMPVDFVKIDRSFVTGLGTSREDTAIVRAVIGLAKSLDLVVIAEGIETPLQMRILQELGCDLGQGFLIGHAAPAETLAAALTDAS